jgi:hypothetical protein
MEASLTVQATAGSGTRPRPAPADPEDAADNHGPRGHGVALCIPLYPAPYASGRAPSHATERSYQHRGAGTAGVVAHLAPLRSHGHRLQLRVASWPWDGHARRDWEEPEPWGDTMRRKSRRIELRNRTNRVNIPWIKYVRYKANVRGRDAAVKQRKRSRSCFTSSASCQLLVHVASMRDVGRWENLRGGQ